MDSGWLLVGVALLGVLVGAAGVLAYWWSERAHEAGAPEPRQDEDVVALLAALHMSSVLLGPGDEILRASADAYASGLVRSGRIAAPEVVALIEAVRRTGEHQSAEIGIRRSSVPAAERLVLDVQVAAVSRGRVLVLAEDRTAQTRVEEVRRDFVANVSHELKTPVGAMALLAETVADAADDPEAVRRFTGRIRTESARLSALVQEIIDLSRLQAPETQLVFADTAIDAVIAEAVDRARVAAEARSITLVAGGAPGLRVVGDHGLLVTAVRNLLDNAVRYSPTGTRVSVGTRARDSLVEIAVVDQGVGLTPAETARVFERFYRGDPARSRETGGSGLGLAIVKHVAANHGGEVTVWSQPGRGSTFTLRIPEFEGALDELLDTNDLSVRPEREGTP